MASYLLIESRDPVAQPDVLNTYALVGGLGSADHDVTLFLTHNAVFGARRNASVSSQLSSLLGVATVIADEFCLSERGIDEHDLVPGVPAVGMDRIVTMVVDEHRTVMWS